MADNAVNLLPVTIITGAVSGIVTPSMPLKNVDQLIFFSVFDWGSGGTNLKLFLQTSIDNGATWADVANHAYLAADLARISVVSAFVAPGSQAFAPTDAALGDNLVVNGLFGDRLRIKYTSTGTYAGNTTIAAWVTGRRRAV
jgi:hypothetical protein